MDSVVLHPLPIESERREIEDELVPRLRALDLDLEISVQSQGLTAGAGQQAIDLLISVPWKALPGYFSALLTAVIAWRGERDRTSGGQAPQDPYRVQVLYGPDGSVLKEIEIPSTSIDDSDAG